jgi:hypothetical protein
MFRTCNSASNANFFNKFKQRACCRQAVLGTLFEKESRCVTVEIERLVQHQTPSQMQKRETTTRLATPKSADAAAAQKGVEEENALMRNSSYIEATGVERMKRDDGRDGKGDN